MFFCTFPVKIVLFESTIVLFEGTRACVKLCVYYLEAQRRVSRYVCVYIMFGGIKACVYTIWRHTSVCVYCLEAHKCVLRCVYTVQRHTGWHMSVCQGMYILFWGTQANTWVCVYCFETYGLTHKRVCILFQNTRADTQACVRVCIYYSVAHGLTYGCMLGCVYIVMRHMVCNNP